MLLSKLLAIPAAALVAVNSTGMDMDYEGEIDPFTDLPVSQGQINESQQTVFVSDGVTYDRETHMFSYQIPDKSGYVQSSIANGMITTESVSLILPEGFSAVIYCDGEEKADLDTSDISAPGNYALVVTGLDVQYQLLSFIIVSEKTGAISSYEMPSGFRLTKLVLNGEQVIVSNPAAADLSAEGEYEVTVTCTATGVSYNLNVMLDHTPPEITLQGVTDGEAHGPVVISGVQPEDSVNLTMDGKKVSVPSDNKLTSPGKYSIIVRDDAGNVFSQDFEIAFYLNMQGLIFTLLAVGVAAAIFLYMFISKKRLKVR